MNWDMDSICDDFEGRWTGGEQPDIANFLNRVADSGHAELLRELLQIELWWRRNATPAPSENEYQARFPGDHPIVAEAFERFRQRSISDQGQPNDDPDATQLQSSPVHAVEQETLIACEPRPGVGERVRYFGEYELIEEIARGGMGVVFKARQVKLNRIVALKMILSGELAGEEEVQRFQTEAEAAANLDHPGIVPIYEIGEHDGQHYFSMGFVEGQSLAERIKDGPLPPTEAAELIRKIAEAIAYAHEKGVIHRDLKPGNVLLDENSEPKVTDFGLAKKIEGDSGLTQTGSVMGTPSYMSPEQAAGRTEEVGPNSDVYSLGAVLYCLVTGRPPFQAANMLDTLKQVTEREAVPPCVINFAIPRDLDTICLRCLEKDVANRYESAMDVAAELARYLHDEPILARPISVLERSWRWCLRHRARTALIASVLLLMLTVTLGGYVFALQETAALNAQTTAERERVKAVVNNVVTADLRALPSLVPQLSLEKKAIVQRLSRIGDDRFGDSDQVARAKIALFALGAAEWSDIAPIILRTSDLEFGGLLALLSDRSESMPLSEIWHSISLAESVEAGSLLKTAAILAVTDSESDQWNSVAEAVASELAEVERGLIPVWTNALHPVRSKLVPYLATKFRDRERHSPRRRTLMAQMLAVLAKGDTVTIVDLLVHADPEPFIILVAALEESHRDAVLQLSAILSSDNEFEDDELNKERIAKRQARAAIALIELREIDDVLPSFRFQPDPRLRSYLIHWMADYGIATDWISKVIVDEETEISIRRALVQSLGEFDSVSDEEKVTLASSAGHLCSHQDAGLSSSARWLFRRWGMLDQVLQELEIAGTATLSNRDVTVRWHRNTIGQRFAEIGPGVFTLGSDFKTDPDSYMMTRESQKSVNIDYRFAMSTTSVTVEQFELFYQYTESGVDARFPIPPNQAVSFLGRVVRTKDSPVTVVYFDGAKLYCNWLSYIDGIDESLWCYKIDRHGKPPLGWSAVLRTDVTESAGYRLPTQPEWEFACRAGTTSRRYFGYCDELLHHYGWYGANSKNRTWPVANLKPNSFGLFDMHGNSYDWCEDGYKRGGCFDSPSFHLRSAMVQGGGLHDGTGFRVVRTVRYGQPDEN